MKNLISIPLIGFMIISAIQAQSGGSSSGSGPDQGTPSSPAPQTPPNPNQGPVNPQTNQPAVNPQTNQGAVNPQTNQGAVIPQTNQAAVNPLSPSMNPANTQFTISGISQTPWFSDPNVQTQLKLTPSQVAKLNQLYAQDWQRFNSSTGQIGSVLTDQQRQQRMQQLTDNFITTFSTSANSILNPDQRTRFSQLWTQSRGFGAFSDPQIQSRMQLTPQQMQSIRQLEQQYNQTLATINQTNASDPAVATSQVTNLRRDFNNKLTALFTDNQRLVWTQLAGDPFTFTIR
jgi:hypothetical protein